MNFSQKVGLFALILISLGYVYFSFFAEAGFHFNSPIVRQFSNQTEELPEIIDDNINDENDVVEKKENKTKTVKIFVSDSNGNLRSLNRECDMNVEKSCFAYAIKELVNAPTKWEKSKGFTSEIPQGTKILSIREGEGSVMIDLSSAFEGGGGTESTYTRVKQLIKTARANTKQPVYLYINGHQAEVIGGEGIMIKQPLSERSLDD